LPQGLGPGVFPKSPNADKSKSRRTFTNGECYVYVRQRTQDRSVPLRRKPWASAASSRRTDWKVTGHAGERGGLYRRIIGYKKTGPFYEQTGWQKDGKPQMRRSFYHRFLHATKGWRVRRTSGPNVTLSNIQQRRAYGPRATGFQSTHGWVQPSRFVPGSAGEVLVPYFRKDKKKVGQQHPGMHTMERKEMFRAPLAA
jgi:hypothetical protein